jgi:hypothetical protein
LEAYTHEAYAGEELSNGHVLVVHYFLTAVLHLLDAVLNM